MVCGEYEYGCALSRKVSAVQNIVNTPNAIEPSTGVTCTVRWARTVVKTDRSSRPYATRGLAGTTGRLRASTPAIMRVTTAAPM